MKRMDPCAFLLSTDVATGRASGMAVTWMNRCDKQSWMVSVNQASHTMQLIRNSREFVLSLASGELVDELTYFGSTKGGQAGVDKFVDTGIKTGMFDDAHIRTPLLPQAYRNIACRVGGILPVSADYAIVYGTIVEQHDNPTAEQLFYCGKLPDSTRRYATQRERTPHLMQVDDLVPSSRLFAPSAAMQNVGYAL